MVISWPPGLRDAPILKPSVFGAGTAPETSIEIGSAAAKFPIIANATITTRGWSLMPSLNSQEIEAPRPPWRAKKEKEYISKSLALLGALGASILFSGPTRERRSRLHC